MGKRALSTQVSQLSQKITKNSNIPCNKKQLNNLIKLLRPKVYITSSSNFKTLVQQLTGNESIKSVKESEHPIQNLKSTDEVIQDIMNPFENYDTITEEQVYSRIESHQESISQELSIDSAEGSMSFTGYEPSIQKSSVTVLDSSIQDTVHPFENLDNVNEGQVYSLTESHQESISQELAVDSWEGSMPSSFTVHEFSSQKSSSTVIQDIMNPFGNFDTINDGKMYFLMESHQESINQELSVDSPKGSAQSPFTVHEPSIQKSSVTVSDSFIACQEMDFSVEYRKMESWLLEIESYSNYHHQE